MKNAQVIRDVKLAAKNRYAWPGGYPLFVLLADGEALCCKCARSCFAQVARSTRDSSRDGWTAVAVDVNWEDSDLQCAHCYQPIESAYC